MEMLEKVVFGLERLDARLFEGWLGMSRSGVRRCTIRLVHLWEPGAV